MSAIGDAEAAIETVTGTRWVHLVLKALPYAAIVMLAIALLITRATLHDVRQADELATANRARDAAQATAADAQRLAAAADTFAQRAAALKPIIVTSHDTVEHYAETSAGRVLCRDADRVRDIDALDATLAAPAAAGGGAGAVPTDTAAPAAGR